MLLTKWFVTPFRITLGLLAIGPKELLEESVRALRTDIGRRQLPEGPLVVVLAGDPGQNFIDTFGEYHTLTMDRGEFTDDFAGRINRELETKGLCRIAVCSSVDFNFSATLLVEMMKREPINIRGILLVANELACVGIHSLLKPAFEELRGEGVRVYLKEVFSRTSSQTALVERIELPEYVLGIGARRVDKELSIYLAEALELYFSTERRTTAKAIRALYWKLYVSILQSIGGSTGANPELQSEASQFCLYCLGLQSLPNDSSNSHWTEIMNACTQLLKDDGVKIND